MKLKQKNVRERRKELKSDKKRRKLLSNADTIIDGNDGSEFVDNTGGLDDIDEFHSNRDMIPLNELEYNSADMTTRLQREVFPLENSDDNDSAEPKKKDRRKEQKRKKKNKLVEMAGGDSSESNDDDDDENDIDDYERRLKQFKRHHMKDLLVAEREKDMIDDSTHRDEKEDQPVGMSSMPVTTLRNKRQFYGGLSNTSVIPSERQEKFREKTRKGMKKKATHDFDDIDDDSNELSAEQLEEREALSLQRKLMSQLEPDDFEFLTTAEGSAGRINLSADDHVGGGLTVNDMIIKEHDDSLPNEDKIRLLQNESPELFDLLDDLKEYTTLMENLLLPLSKYFRESSSQRGNHPKILLNYLEYKTNLTLTYTSTILFYLMLKGKRTNVDILKNHPVIMRLVQCRKLLGKLKPLDIELMSSLIKLVGVLREKEKDNKNLFYSLKESTVFVESFSYKHENKSRENNSEKIDNNMTKNIVYQSLCPDNAISDSSDSDLSDNDMTPVVDDEKSILMSRVQLSRSQDDDGDDKITNSDEDANSASAKRPIDYDIAKNKGLTAKRKKELRNPRVKHRNKYRRAVIRRKGQVKSVRKELEPYAGEPSGIRIGVKHGIKLK